MRTGTRPLAALGVTAVGLTVMLRYHTPRTVPTRPPTPVALSRVPAASPALQRLSNPTPTSAPTRTVTTPAPTPPARAATGRSAGTPHRTAVPHPTRTTSAAAPVQSYTCQPFQAGSFGPVQVQIKVQGSRWVDVVNLQLPSGDATTDSISANAGPQLRHEALTVQNANIDNISGATYTTDAYRQSLQSCINSW